MSIDGKLHRYSIFHHDLRKPVTAAQVAHVSNFPPVPAEGLSRYLVGFLELGGQTSGKDLSAYCLKNGALTPDQLPDLIVDGASESQDPADGEVSLDQQVNAGATSTATAKGATQLVGFGKNTEQSFANTIDGLRSAIKGKILSGEMKGGAISVSWGGPRDQWSDVGHAAMEAVLESCAQDGIPVFTASGDNGSGDGEHGQHADYPACSKWVIAVGGTSLILNDDGSRQSEKVWTPGLLGGGGSTGGGISQQDDQPAWQQGLLPNLPAGRRVPDLTFNADPKTGYLVIVDGSEEQVGGTSSGSPMAAAMAIRMMAAGAKLTGSPADFYKAKEAYFDVTQGNNGAYKAGQGFDLDSGLGVPDATKLVAALQ